MRALRVVGLSEDGETVILEDLTRSERFMIPADERLRAAARGDITRLGQIAIELESQMRPREIQTRIRAGESVDQIAAASGLPVNKVERFAYPVLLERARTAELAQRAHPVREDGPDVQTLAEVAAHAFGLRGQDYATVTWDSWRGEDGKWVAQLSWQTGRSENHAHWAFHPGAHGGTVSPLDDLALDLMDPTAANRPLRTVRPVTELARQAMDVAPAPVRVVEPEPEPAPQVEEPPARTSRSVVVEPEAPPSRPAVVEPEAPAARVSRPAVVEPEAPAARASRPAVVEPEAPAAPVSRPAVVETVVEPELTPEVAEPEPEPVAAPAKASKPAEPEPVAEEPEPEQPAMLPEPERAPEPAARKEPPAPAKRGKKNHPIVPSWEDVLLGVRGQRG